MDIHDNKKARDVITSSDTSHMSPVRSKIWNLKLPGKVRIFLWRLTHNSLPLRLNIKRKKIELDTRCPICERLDEDGGHLFLKCKKVKKVWRQLLLEDVRIQLMAAPNSLVFMDSIWSLPKEKQELVCILLWDWWTTRNKVNAGEKERTVDEVCHIVQRHAIEFSPRIFNPVSAHAHEST